MPNPVKLGDPVTFCPVAFSDTPIVTGSGGRKLSRMVTGHVVYINAPKRYYTVEFTVNGYRLLETFKFGEPK